MCLVKGKPFFLSSPGGLSSESSYECTGRGPGSSARHLFCRCLAGIHHEYFPASLWFLERGFVLVGLEVVLVKLES